jgi:hypothetical protein
MVTDTFYIEPKVCRNAHYHGEDKKIKYTKLLSAEFEPATQRLHDHMTINITTEPFKLLCLRE